MADLNRRGFLKVAGTAGLAFAAGCRGNVPTNSGSSSATQTPTVGASGTPLPSAPMEILITPISQLYTQSFSRVPSVDPSTWRLVVDGLVEQPLTLGYRDVVQFPKVESVRTLECIGNPVGGPLIGNPAWGGFDPQDLWNRVGIKSEAVRAKFTAADGYETSVDVSWIIQPGVLLAYEVNGEPLPEEHGFPLRILMPGLYGQKMPKWITHIEFIDSKFLGYWESRGWSDIASVKTSSIVRQPSNLEEIPPGVLPVLGIAFAGLRRITAVEVRIDGGEWMRAELVQDESPLVWTQSMFKWNASPGRHAIAVRAEDKTGFVQSSEASSILSSAFPDGTDRIHETVVVVTG